MPAGLVRSGDYRLGTPILIFHQFGNQVTLPWVFGNPIPQPNATLNSNPVTWLPSPTRFGNQIGYSLQSVPPVITIAQGSTGDVTIPITNLNGVVNSVALSESGQPTGVSIVFTPNPATNSSLATITVGSNVMTGRYTITIPGTSGTETENTNIQLVVLASGSTTDFLLQEDGVSLFELEDGSGFILLEN